MSLKHETRGALEKAKDQLMPSKSKDPKVRAAAAFAKKNNALNSKAPLFAAYRKDAKGKAWRKKRKEYIEKNSAKMSPADHLEALREQSKKTTSSQEYKDAHKKYIRGGRMGALGLMGGGVAGWALPQLLKKRIGGGAAGALSILGGAAGGFAGSHLGKKKRREGRREGRKLIAPHIRDQVSALRKQRVGRMSGLNYIAHQAQGGSPYKAGDSIRKGLKDPLARKLYNLSSNEDRAKFLKKEISSGRLKPTMNMKARENDLKGYFDSHVGRFRD